MQTNAIRKFNLNLLRFPLNIQWQNTPMVAAQTLLCKINNATQQTNVGLKSTNTGTSTGYQSKRYQNIRTTKIQNKNIKTNKNGGAKAPNS